jgi:hypothetical protein
MKPKQAKPLGELSFVLTAELRPQDLGASTCPVLRASATTVKPFRPETVIAWAEVDATFRDAIQDAIDVSRELRNRDELEQIVLVGLSVDGTERLAIELPMGESPPPRGISLAAFASNALGGGVSWPPCHRSADVAFYVGRELLSSVETKAANESHSLVSVRLAIHLRLIGPVLR